MNNSTASSQPEPRDFHQENNKSPKVDLASSLDETSVGIDKLSAVKKMAQEGFLEFCLAIDSEGDNQYQPTWFHELLTNKLQEAYEKVQRGEKVRLIIQVPPRHGKTRASTVLFPAWVLGKSNVPIVATSYAQDLSDKFGQDTRDVLSNPMYHQIFPNTKLRPDMTAKGNWATTTGGSYFGTGVGGVLTGKGFKIGIIDDPFKSREEADSQNERDRVWSWYKSTFSTRKEGNAAIIVIMTRWHVDDLVGRLLETQEKLDQSGTTEPYDRWDVIRFPAIAEEDEEFRKEGEALWPQKYSIDQLVAERNSTDDAYEWSALYQQNPILSTNAVFNKNWFKYFEEEEIVGKDLRVYITVDPGGEKNKNDKTSIQVVGKEHDGTSWYHLEEITANLDPLEIIEALFMLKAKYGSRLAKVGIEAFVYQKSLVYYVTEQQKIRQSFFDVVEIKGKGSKEERIKSLVPLYKSGTLYHRKADVELERELLQFPRGKHDDRADALSMMTQLIEPTRSSMFAKQFFPRIKRY